MSLLSCLYQTTWPTYPRECIRLVHFHIQGIISRGQDLTKILIFFVLYGNSSILRPHYCTKLVRLPASQATVRLVRTSVSWSSIVYFAIFHHLLCPASKHYANWLITVTLNCSNKIYFLCILTNYALSIVRNFMFIRECKDNTFRFCSRGPHSLNDDSNHSDVFVW